MSAAVAAAAAAACYSSSSKSNSRTQNHNSVLSLPLTHAPVVLPCFSRYEAEKRRDWNTFMQYLNNQRPPLALSRCSGAHVLEFLKYLDEFGQTKVHGQTCPFFGVSNGPTPCSCPLRQSWGSLDGIIGRLRVAFEENGGRPETNPFSCPALMVYLRQVRDEQAKPRGMGYEKKKSKINPQNIYG